MVDAHFTPDERIRQAIAKARKKGFVPTIMRIEQVTAETGADYVIAFAMSVTPDVVKCITKHTPLEVVSTDGPCLYIKIPAEWNSAPTEDMFADAGEELEAKHVPVVTLPEPDLSPDLLWRLRIAYFAADQSARAGQVMPVQPADLQMGEGEVQEHFVSKGLMARGLGGGYHITPSGCKLLGCDYPTRQRPLENIAAPQDIAQATQNKSLVLTVADGETLHPILDEQEAQGWRVVFRQFIVTMLPNGMPAMRLAVGLQRDVIAAPQQEVERVAEAIPAANVSAVGVFVADVVSLRVRQPVMNSVESQVADRMMELVGEQIQVGRTVYTEGQRHAR